MEEVGGGQVVPPIFIHQTLAGRFCDVPSSMAKKRALSSSSYQLPNFPHQTHTWNPNSWDWDSSRFLTKPNHNNMSTRVPEVSEDQSLRLNLNLNSEDPVLTKPPKKVRPSSPVCATPTPTYPMCQVDHCKEDLSNAKDYHRRHKVCEIHSKSSKALLSNLMQRFCQQCSRFHPLSEFDDGKRSCRRRLAGHNWRRRKTQPEDVTSRLTTTRPGARPPPPPPPPTNANFDILHLLTALARSQAGKNEDQNIKSLLLSTNSDQLIQILNKINSIPLPPDLAAKLPNLESFHQNQNKFCGNPSSPSTMDLLTTLSSSLATASTTPDALALLSQKTSSLSNDNSDKTRFSYPSASDFHNTTLELPSSFGGERSSTSYQSPMEDSDGQIQATASTTPDALALLSQKGSSLSSDNSDKTRSSHPSVSDFHNTTLELPSSFGGERSSTSYQSPMEDSDGQVQGTRLSLPLQLFGSSPEHDDTPPKLDASRKYFSSDSSNPIEERSPSSSPPFLQKLFPVQSTEQTTHNRKIQTRKEASEIVEEVGKAPASNIPFQLFRGLDRGAGPDLFQSVPHQAGYSSSGSDHSPSSLNSGAQDRTGRIIFKLFDKDPSHFPGTLRTQIYNWLSNSPSEMESYIRPGCVVLSIYMSMPSIAWEQLEENLVRHVKSLVQSAEFDFWRNGRFLVHIGRQLASHKDGKIRLSKSWKALNCPELISVSPLAVISGQKTSFLLRGKNLKNPGTRIHCTSMGGYISEEVTGSIRQGDAYDEIRSGSFKIGDASTSTLGRCFIEVENGFKGNGFPVIIADAVICKELRHLESEFDKAKISNINSEGHVYVPGGQPMLKDEVLYFLNELGWLFQRERPSSELDIPDYLTIRRFKFLLTFSVERDFFALVKTLLDILVKKCLITDGLSVKSLEMISEIQLLNRAVKRRCRQMVDLLVRYSVSGIDDVEKYIFPPNFMGPGGVTPLHVAASMTNSEDMVDALTNDPLEAGLGCWSSLLDANGQSPRDYALMRGSHSYNQLVDQKLADRKNGQVSVRIENEIEQPQVSTSQEVRLNDRPTQGRPCSRCAIVAAKCNRRNPGSKSLLHRPYVHSMLAIAAVCVCVCLFLRGSPDIGLVAPFKWENLDYGTI